MRFISKHLLEIPMVSLIREEKTRFFTRTVILVMVLYSVLFPSSVFAVDVRAVVDRMSMTMEETNQLTVTVSGGEASVDVSGIDDFNIISRGSSTSIRIVNGNMSREVSYTYTIIPKRKGRLRIPPLRIVSDGTTQLTREIIVNVESHPQTEKRDDQRDVFVKARVSKANPFVGEQIRYTFRLYNAVRIANAEFRKKPDFAEFTAKEMEQGKSYRTVISGREYVVNEVNYMLIPQKAGDVVIAPAVVGCDVFSPSRRRTRSPFDIFNDPFFGGGNYKSRILRTEPIDVHVRPLPDFPGPGKFSGLVGHFSIKTDLEKKEVGVGDSTTLSIHVEGTGNVMDMEIPDIPIPQGIKVYKDSPETDVQLTRDGYSGKKVFRLALVPVKPGNYTIDPVTFSFFDVEKGRYVTRSTRPQTLSVVPGKEKEKVEIFTADQPVKPLKKKKVTFVGRDILPLKDDLSALESKWDMTPIHFFVFLAVPALLFLLMRILVRIFEKKEDTSVIMAERARKAIREAERGGEDFFTNVYTAFVSSLFSKNGLRGETLTKTELEKMLKENGFDDNLIREAAELLERIESARFSGSEPDEMFRKNMYCDTKKMVDLMIGK